MKILRGAPTAPARAGAQALDLRAEPRPQRVGEEDRDERANRGYRGGARAGGGGSAPGGPPGRSPRRGMSRARSGGRPLPHARAPPNWERPRGTPPPAG